MVGTQLLHQRNARRSLGRLSGEQRSRRRHAAESQHHHGHEWRCRSRRCWAGAKCGGRWRRLRRFDAAAPARLRRCRRQQSARRWRRDSLARLWHCLDQRSDQRRRSSRLRAVVALQSLSQLRQHRRCRRQQRRNDFHQRLHARARRQSLLALGRGRQRQFRRFWRRQRRAHRSPRAQFCAAGARLHQYRWWQFGQLQ